MIVRVVSWYIVNVVIKVRIFKNYFFFDNCIYVFFYGLKRFDNVYK